MNTLSTRLTRRFNLRHHIVSAPMALAAGGGLAAAVSRAGGLGLTGGGYGDETWLDQQFAASAGERVGVGFITWSLCKSPSLPTRVLQHRPAAVMLSFGDPRPFVDEIRRAGRQSSANARAWPTYSMQSRPVPTLCLPTRRTGIPC